METVDLQLIPIQEEASEYDTIVCYNENEQENKGVKRINADLFVSTSTLNNYIPKRGTLTDAISITAQYFVFATSGINPAQLSLNQNGDVTVGGRNVNIVGNVSNTLYAPVIEFRYSTDLAFYGNRPKWFNSVNETYNDIAIVADLDELYKRTAAPSFDLSSTNEGNFEFDNFTLTIKRQDTTTLIFTITSKVDTEVFVDYNWMAANTNNAFESKYNLSANIPQTIITTNGNPVWTFLSISTTDNLYRFELPGSGNENSRLIYVKITK